MSRFALFDLDGTLTDPKLGIVNCIQYAFQKLGHDVPEQKSLISWIGPPLLQSFQQALQGDLVMAEQALTFYRERFSTVGLLENELIPEIVDALEEFRQNQIRLYVATSKPTVYAKRICQHFKIEAYFEAVYGSELDGTRTDKVELIRHILNEESLDVSQGLMIGDRQHDMVGASGNGLAAIGVLWGYGSVEELQQANAGWIAFSPSELFDCCNRVFGTGFSGVS